MPKLLDNLPKELQIREYMFGKDRIY